uniref:Bm1141 n=1 Tax=Brugia malayi TaxID=6279 RepID=A0A1I9G6L8_BRUMA|nr:Bm1141 [Brugia malayi]
MSAKRYSKKNGDLSQCSSQIVTAIDTFTASDYLVGDSMDNIEGMLRLLINNPRNLIIFKYPNDTTRRYFKSF